MAQKANYFKLCLTLSLFDIEEIDELLNADQETSLDAKNMSEEDIDDILEE